jgi:hypothetical protein
MKIKLCSRNREFLNKGEKARYEKAGFKVKKDSYRNGYFKLVEASIDVELNTMEDLLKIIDVVGDIVIYKDKPNEITIYDTYIE